MYKNVKQRSIADCGAACMATVAETYGIHISLDKMRELAHTDRQGNNLRGLIEAAQALGFEADPVMGDSEALLTEKFPLPAIVQITSEAGSSHYVVLHKICPDRVVIADPASKIVNVPMEQFLAMWSGVILLLRPGSDFKKGRRSPGILRTIIGLAGQQKKLFAVIALTSLTASFLGIAASGVYSVLIDQVIPQREHELVFTVCTAVILIYLLQTILEYFRGRCMITLSTRIDDSIVTGFLSHIMKLPMDFFSSYRSGEIFSRVSDAENLRDALSSTVLTVLVDCVMAIAAGAVICTISPLLFIAALIIASVYGILVGAFSRSLRRKTEKRAEDDAVFTACTLEAIDCAETAKACGAESCFSDRAVGFFRTFLDSLKRLERTGNLQRTLTSAAACTGNILLLMLGADMVIHGALTLGIFFQFTAMLAYFLDPVKNILGIQSALQSAAVSAKRLSGILELRQENEESEKHIESSGYTAITDIEECRELEREKMIRREAGPDIDVPASFALTGDIAVRDLCFRYGSRETILENADLIVRGGSKTALVGSSGSGKSTLAKILMRFYDFESGEILIGDTDLRKIPRRKLRSKIAYVSQDIQLFTGSIRDNLKIASPDASDEDIFAACRSANIYDLITLLPGGLDYTLDEKGTNLSMGERQRLCIARAFLRRPDILILDEATSNLDTVSEQVIWDSISSMKNVTVLCIAHRLSSVCRCDEIFVIDGKKIRRARNA